MSNNGVLQALRAEALLANSDILTRIETLRKSLLYSSEGEQVAFDAYVTTIREAVDGIPKLELETDVVPGTESQYSIQLVTSMERIVDDCDRVLRKLAHFQGRLRDAERQINNLKSEFVAWYVLQAGALLAGLEDVKLPQKEIRSLAEAEFSRLMGNVDLKIETILEDLKLEFERVAQHKATQKEKHNLGKDQANASWTSSLPSFGNAFPEDERTDKLNKPQDFDDFEEEGVPEFIKRKPKISDVRSDVQKRLDKAKPGDTVVIRSVENLTPKIADIKDTSRLFCSDCGGATDYSTVNAGRGVCRCPRDDNSVVIHTREGGEIVGTFKKTVTAPTEVVKDEAGEPVIVEQPKSARKRLILDDEVL